MDSALGITGWAFANVFDWSEVDLKVDNDNRQSRCVSIRTHEPNETLDTIAAIRRPRVRSIVRDSIGPDKFDLLTSIGAIDVVLDSVEAHIMTTDDKSYVLGVDTWVDSDIEITLDWFLRARHGLGGRSGLWCIRSRIGGVQASAELRCC